MSAVFKARPGEDVEMMQYPHRWPRYPYLPVKRRKRGELPELGVMYAFSTSPTVYVADIYDLPQDVPVTELPSIRRLHFSDYEAIVDAGWLVD